jgi:hypothetical protein
MIYMSLRATTPSDSAARYWIFAPIIAITLVLLSVFAPVAFIPGIAGELFRGVDVPLRDRRADAVPAT